MSIPLFSCRYVTCQSMNLFWSSVNDWTLLCIIISEKILIPFVLLVLLWWAFPLTTLACKHNSFDTVGVWYCREMYSAQRFYFKIIYLHIIGMKTGWYICDGTGQFPYRNTQSTQKPLFQTWTKWINILVNKYISDMSLYWNVLLYIKYNTISFLFLLFSFLYTKYPKYTDISLKVLEGFLLIEKAVSAHYSCKT